jgi:hypothetical protein
MPIPRNHAVYRCFFDTDISDGSPIPFRDILCPHRQPRTCLDGVFIGERLVLVYSEKRFGELWDTMERIQHGCNILIYAFLSEGKLRRTADSGQ